MELETWVQILDEAVSILFRTNPHLNPLEKKWPFNPVLLITEEVGKYIH